MDQTPGAPSAASAGHSNEPGTSSSGARAEEQERIRPQPPQTQHPQQSPEPIPAQSPTRSPPLATATSDSHLPPGSSASASGSPGATAAVPAASGSSYPASSHAAATAVGEGPATGSNAGAGPSSSSLGLMSSSIDLDFDLGVDVDEAMNMDMDQMQMQMQMQMADLGDIDFGGLAEQFGAAGTPHQEQQQPPVPPPPVSAGGGSAQAGAGAGSAAGEPERIRRDASHRPSRPDRGEAGREGPTESGAGTGDQATAADAAAAAAAVAAAAGVSHDSTRSADRTSSGSAEEEQRDDAERIRDSSAQVAESTGNQPIPADGATGNASSSSTSQPVHATHRDSTETSGTRSPEPRQHQHEQVSHEQEPGREGERSIDLSEVDMEALLHSTVEGMLDSAMHFPSDSAAVSSSAPTAAPQEDRRATEAGEVGDPKAAQGERIGGTSSAAGPQGKADQGQSAEPPEDDLEDVDLDKQVAAMIGSAMGGFEPSSDGKQTGKRLSSLARSNCAADKVIRR